jgi:hypothetical protein
MLPTTAERVRRNTAAKVNREIDDETAESVARYADASPRQIERRLRELDAEWDVERCLETAAPTFSLIGLVLGVTKDRRWLFFPAFVQAFLLQHAVQGWCPPLVALR